MDTMTTVNTGIQLPSASATWVKSAQMSMCANWALGAAAGSNLGAADRSKLGAAEGSELGAAAYQAYPAPASARVFAGRPTSTSKIADQADHRGFDATVITFSTRLGLSSGSPPV
jgi:hypothetical protein